MPDPLNTRTAERLLAWADLSEKSVDFLPDGEMIHETLAEVALLREAAHALQAAREALRAVDYFGDALIARDYEPGSSTVTGLVKQARAALAPEQTEGTA